MAELKTQPTEQSVQDFLEAIDDRQKKVDSIKISKLMEEISGSKPKMWGGSIVGFGDYRYKYASGREGDWFLVGFSPRKQNISLYLMCTVDTGSKYYKSLGKFKHGKSCIYIKKLDDINRDVLIEMIKDSIKQVKEKYSG
ncbi:MAG: DUF1801 domain-containing protein [Bacteroidales bacterium]